MSPAAGTSASLQSSFEELWVEDTVTPALLPKTPEDVQRIVVWCRENSWRMLPVGSGHTFSAGFQVPGGVVTVLTLGRDGLSEPDPLDLVIEAETGVPANVVNSQVQSAGFRLDGWPAEYSGTVGGLLCGTDGPRLRHLVLGIDSIDGRGRALRFGGRVRKNVSGFDIAGLMVGSQGRVGWMDRVYLRLTPSGAPEVTRTAQPARTVSRALTGLFLRVSRALDPDDVFLKSDA
ncbi:FAD-binding oxidoreductase [bacterium]|nr:FAD-binding oxidoreductase [bacterium]